jgi:hypothetical protein
MMGAVLMDRRHLGLATRLILVLATAILIDGCVGDHFPKVFMSNNSDETIRFTVPGTTPGGRSAPIPPHQVVEAFNGIAGIGGGLLVKVYAADGKRVLQTQALFSDDITARMKTGDLRLEYPLAQPLKRKS